MIKITTMILLLLLILIMIIIMAIGFFNVVNDTVKGPVKY